MLESFFEIPLIIHIMINIWGFPLYFFLLYLIKKGRISLNKRIKNKQTLLLYCMIIVLFGYVAFI